MLSEKQSFSNLGGTQQQKSLALRDVPLPRDFELLETAEDHPIGSFWHATQTFRYGEFVLEGSEPVPQIVAFYRRQMPSGGWKENEYQDLEAAARMRYESKDELCTVLIRDLGQKTQVKITIEQKKS